MPEPASISAGPSRLYELANCVLMLCANDIVFIIFFHLLCSVVVLTCFVIPKIIRILLICFVIISLFLRLCICHLLQLLVLLCSSLGVFNWRNLCYFFQKFGFLDNLASSTQSYSYRIFGCFSCNLYSYFHLGQGCLSLGSPQGCCSFRFFRLLP